MKVCKECKKDFEPKNTKAIFCGSVCRQRDYRKEVAKKLKTFAKMTEKREPSKPNEVESPKQSGKELTFHQKMLNLKLGIK